MFLANIALIICLGVVIEQLLTRLRMPTMLGFILLGICLGPLAMTFLRPT